MSGFWKFDTPRGTFTIVPVGDDFEARFEDESLGSYDSAQDALDDLIGGHTLTPSRGFNTSTVGLPGELSGWTFVRLG